jgi:hypothetical protein
MLLPQSFFFYFIITKRVKVGKKRNYKEIILEVTNPFSSALIMCLKSFGQSTKKQHSTPTFKNVMLSVFDKSD